ncbi:MAG: hypothetical protein K9N62_18130 [Verrucomicrobia bacterium]|nr:hypothetical protein [Verrucomicrobiota bacterium]
MIRSGSFFAVALAIRFACGGAPTSSAAPASPENPTSAESNPPIRLIPNPAPGTSSYFEISHPAFDSLSPESRNTLNSFDWSQVFTVTVAGSGSQNNLPPISGRYLLESNTLRLTPTFPIEKGIRYLARFQPGKLPPTLSGAGKTDSSGEAITRTFLIPAPQPVATASVLRVSPTADVLPENQLKFYLYFSAPMSRGQGYEHIHLTTTNGTPVDLPFLEIDEELWNRDGTRLTLFFDPGRIKRGLLPREQVGPSLHAGERYTLLIERHWKDASGNPLIRDFQKTFQVSEPDYTSPDPKAWTISPPGAGTRHPLLLRFEEALDRALINRLIWITDSTGQEVSGTIEIPDGETSWRFLPNHDWTAGTYQLHAGTVIEDLAGNSIARPFEVDAFPPVRKQLEEQFVSLRFDIAP